MKYRIGNLVINSDHIISVEYDPESSGIDDETNLPYHRDSRIDITTTAVVRDVEYGFEGRVDGVGSKSDVIIMRGAQADRFWEVYSGDSYRVM